MTEGKRTRGAGARPGVGRLAGLALRAALHALLAGGSRVALAGFPRVDGIPVLRGPGTGTELRGQLEEALAVLGRLAPGRRERLRRHVTGIFVTRTPGEHGHYSRITGTCSLDPRRLGQEGPAETAAMLVRCATEAWLWRAGRGRLRSDEDLLLAVSERARRGFLQRATSPVAGRPVEPARPG